MNPSPFFVKAAEKMLNEQKIECIRDDAEASLQEFAVVYLLFFTEKVCETKHRAKCLELYRLLSPAAKGINKSDLHPAALEGSLRVFDPTAPRCCRWCGKQLHPSQSGAIADVYCSPQREVADRPAPQCSRCHSLSVRTIVARPARRTRP